ncbi:MAG: TRAP transporter large permease subunit [Spirochaetaceae bacterium]|jgi:tripartite ATP-independent transporter DctM subunit|nr:TRAP transporter large permease subunit [Spirochaetaceae bacterium]
MNFIKVFGKNSGGVEGVRRFWHIIENGAACTAIMLIAVISVLESVLRFALHTGIPYSQQLIPHLLLVTGCVSLMITTRQKEHLSIGLIEYVKNEKLRKIIDVFSNALSAFVSCVLVFCSLVFIKIAIGTSAGNSGVYERFFAMALPLGYAVSALRFAKAMPLAGRLRFLRLLPFVFGILCSAPLLFKLRWGFDLPDNIFELSNLYIDIAEKIKIPALIIFAILALAGTPLFIILAAFALVLFESSGWEVDTIVVNISAALTTNDYIAIPLFTLVGFFLSESRAGERLVAAFKCLFGWFPGGLIFVSALLCAFFTTFTGASGVTILALGGLLFSILSENAKYPPRFSRGLLTSAGSIGLLFPPSLPIILVAVTMQQSVLKFFAGGLLPGLLLTGATIVFGIIISKKKHIPLERFSASKAIHALGGSIFELLLPVILVGGFFSGILSLVEIGAAALVYVFIVEVFIIRDIKLRNVPAVFGKALPIIGGILAILAVSKALSDYIVFTQAPENFARALRETLSSKWLFLLILNAVLLVTGCLMDIFSATMVVLPLIAPLSEVYGVEPIHLGIIFLVNLEAGYLTPPVGLNLFLASYRFKVPFVEICRAVLPFLFIQLVVVLLVTYIPALSTFLPSL